MNGGFGRRRSTLPPPKRGVIFRAELRSRAVVHSYFPASQPSLEIPLRRPGRTKPLVSPKPRPRIPWPFPAHRDAAVIRKEDSLHLVAVS
jgi:hypothetical protein